MGDAGGGQARFLLSFLFKWGYSLDSAKGLSNVSLGM